MNLNYYEIKALQHRWDRVEGLPAGVNLFVCPVCGTVVDVKSAHENWHIQVQGKSE